MRSLLKPVRLCRIAILCLAAWGCLAAVAQVPEQMGTYVSPRHRRMEQIDTQQQQQQQPALAPAPTPAPAPAATPAPAQPQAFAAPAAVPPSLLDKPPQPAKVSLAQGRLAIEADNSSLIDIMHRLTADAGMTVDGLNKDQRIFGTYGPGDPQEIISQLLDGMGYNVVMLGRTPSGTPKQITLTARVGGVPSPGGMRAQPMNQDDEAEDDAPQPQPIINPPAEQQSNPQQPGGVRTPQQMLEELQRMRQQQMQQQAQPPPPQQQ
jgi:hypothetical protein